ncbi:MAG TPA: hypothetical protein ENI22_01350 [Candidatus Pacearchaeota archaeon]|nr:hypothetical protein [Candidatus Pacearchaeota archaeon]
MTFSFSFFFLGDTHSFIDDFKKQKEIIEEIKPDFVLYERLENHSLKTKEDYEKILRTRKISNMTSFDEVEKIIKFCFKKKIKLIGIDFKNFGLNKNLQEKVKKQLPLKGRKRQLDKILKRREIKHIQMIKKYTRKTKKPILITIGSWHLKEDSKLMNAFDRYKVIFPCGGKGNLLLGPPEKGKVFYCERVKWAKK